MDPHSEGLGSIGCLSLICRSGYSWYVVSGITSSRNFVINMDGRGSGEIQTHKLKLDYEGESGASWSGASGSGASGYEASWYGVSWYEMIGSEESGSDYSMDTKEYEDTLTQKVKYNLSCTCVSGLFLNLVNHT